ncbi:MAG: LysM peptidoglycan-binding domain-containing protein [Chloroflexi bacterium]|nr:LysM peptidoglycan-binding domain-containing protein [Chloroflexota bacterium]
MSFRRMLPFILINVVVSAVVVLGILYWWENRDDGVITAVGVETAVSTTPLPSDATAAAPVVQPTETSEPEDEIPIHVVQGGDTLGTISQFYDVPIEDIMAANNMNNANLISVGQQLIIPINGLATPIPDPTATTAPNTLPTPIATEVVETGDSLIEISQVIGVGELSAEAVQIRNVGSNPEALLAWKLADQDGNFYAFGQVTLFGDGAGILVHTQTGQNGATEVYWGQAEAVWESGELVTLLNANGEIVTTYQIP